jgi:hypothetical protein
LRQTAEIPPRRCAATAIFTAAPIQPLRERTRERRADDPAKVPIVTKRVAQALHGKRR